MTRDEEVIYLARKLKFVRELPNNRGARVEAIQRWSGGEPGSSWCAFFATMILDIVYEGKSPLPRTGSCDVLLETAREHGWLTNIPAPGDLYLLLRNANDAHHVGIVTERLAGDKFREVSGNTNDDGSSNGNGVYERERVAIRGAVVFIAYPRGDA